MSNLPGHLRLITTPNATSCVIKTKYSHDRNKKLPITLWNRKFPINARGTNINGGCRRGNKSMKFSGLISSTSRIWAKNSTRPVIRSFPVRVLNRLVSSTMDPGNSTENGAVVEKTASQLKKEAQRLAKLEKFNKKKEKEAALAENQNQVSG